MYFIRSTLHNNFTDGPLDSPLKELTAAGSDLKAYWHLINCLQNGLPFDQDVYDAAAWSSNKHNMDIDLIRCGNTKINICSLLKSI